jgi:Protein of unknown function (DUF2442)
MKPSYGTAIKGVRAADGYRLRVVFQDGYIGEVDLQPLFEKPRGPLAEAFQDPAFFAKVSVESNAAAWPNGYDIDPDVLRYYCEIGRVCSREELAAAFEQPEFSPMTLNDKQKS